jgi:uncharacterized protein
MTIATAQITMHLFGVHSLKEKRRIVKSVIERLKNKFNASVSEIDDNDNKLKALIGISIAGNNGRHTGSQLDKMLDFMRNDTRFTTGNVERETFTV